VLLIVLWVQSYYWVEVFQLPTTKNNVLQIGLIPGRFLIGEIDQPRAWWISHPIPAVDFRDIIVSGDFLTSGHIPSFEEMLQMKFPGHVSLPYWLIIIPTGIFAVAPWLRWRFSLRTLLVGTTLVAVVFGLIVWSMR